MGFAIGIDLGGTSVKSVVVDSEGGLIEQKNTPFDDNDNQDWAREIQSLINTVQQQQESTASARVGLSAPGLAAKDGRSIAFMPGRLQGLEGLNWTEFLQSTATIPVLNDAHAALLGEVWQGAAKGLQNVIMLTLGTGVGGAAMVDGQLLRGAIGRAGHLGHATLDAEGPRDICNMPGALEICIGNCTVQERSNDRFTTTHELVEAHLTGDSFATEIWNKSIHHLACAIGSFINILDPSAVVIGGGIARAGDALFSPLEEKLRDVEWQPGGHTVQLLPATLGEYAGAFGAAWAAFNG